MKCVQYGSAFPDMIYSALAGVMTFTMLSWFGASMFHHRTETTMLVSSVVVASIFSLVLYLNIPVIFSFRVYFGSWFIAYGISTILELQYYQWKDAFYHDAFDYGMMAIIILVGILIIVV